MTKRTLLAGALVAAIVMWLLIVLLGEFGISLW